VDVGSDPYRIVSGDFNGDGRTDLGVTKVRYGYVSVLYGLAGRGFGARQDVGVGRYPHAIVSGDFNGDGRADLAVANAGDDDVSVLYSLPEGGFGDRQDVGVGGIPYSIASGDFNGDGRADLAVTNHSDDDVSVLHGLPGGGLGERQDVAVGDYPYGIVSGDFDGDGRVDLAVANSGDDDVSVLYGQPGGRFGDRQDVDVGAEPSRIIPADFNGDGWPDLAIANHSDQDVSVLYGLPGGGFGARQDVPVAGSPNCIAAGDFNGDGQPDLAVTDSAWDRVTVLYNRSRDLLDGMPPTVASVRIEQAGGGITFGFSETVGIARSDLAITDAGGTPIDLTDATLDHVPGRGEATLRLAERPPAGYYRITLKAANVQDLAANPLDGDANGTGGDDYVASFMVALPGDVDLSGDVGRADFVSLRSSFGTGSSARWEHGDSDGDGDVDAFDYVALKRNCGRALAAPQPQPAADAAPTDPAQPAPDAAPTAEEEALDTRSEALAAAAIVWAQPAARPTTQVADSAAATDALSVPPVAAAPGIPLTDAEAPAWASPGASEAPAPVDAPAVGSDLIDVLESPRLRPLQLPLR